MNAKTIVFGITELERGMEKELSISVVVCTYNRSENLKNCLASIFMQTYRNYEIVIIDDHSQDRTTDLLKDYCNAYPQLRVHRNDQNKGISYSRNKAVSISANEIIAFLDDDCIADENWLTELARPFEDQRVVVVGGLIKDPDPVNLAMVAARGHYKRFTEEGPCDSLPGGAANLAVRKTFYLNNPITDKALEDWELCQKAIETNQVVYNCPKAIVVHKHFHNLRTLFRQRYRYGIGQTWFRKKYKPFPINLKTVILLLALALLPMIFFRQLFLFIFFLISFILLIIIFYKDFRKGEKTISQAIVSLPIFILIAGAECYGRIIGLFKKPTQINFGTDYVKLK